jgi:hypothetical protein
MEVKSSIMTSTPAPPHLGKASRPSPYFGFIPLTNIPLADPVPAKKKNKNYQTNPFRISTRPCPSMHYTEFNAFREKNEPNLPTQNRPPNLPRDVIKSDGPLSPRSVLSPSPRPGGVRGFRVLSNSPTIQSLVFRRMPPAKLTISPPASHSCMPDRVRLQWRTK